MEKTKINNRMGIFFVILFLESATANFVHPVTPTFLKALNVNDYMFGVAFAAMSLAQFLLSPFWGKIGKMFSSKKALLIGCSGYALGQVVFVNAKTELAIFLARCLSGCFVGAVSVCVLTYTVNMSEPEKRGRNLAINSALTTISGSFGFLVGGLLGEISVEAAFYVQIASLVICGILFAIFLRDDSGVKMQSGNGEKRKVTLKEFAKEANPFAAFLTAREFMTKAVFLLFVVVFLANVGTNSYDQCFNYYIKDQFNFSSSYNGIIKAAVGVIAMISNFTICMRLLKKKNVAFSTAGVLLLCAIAMAGICLIPWMIPFFCVVMIFYAVNSIYIPLLQDCVARCEKNGNGNMIMAFFNSVRSLGSIFGALTAGFIYGYMPKAPFIMACGFFFLAAICLFLYSRKQEKTENA